MHLLAVNAVEPNQTELAIQITDIFRHLKNLTACLHDLRRENRLAHMKIERLWAKLTQITANVGVSLDESTTSDLHQVMQEEEEQVAQKFPPGSFQHIF